VSWIQQSISAVKDLPAIIIRNIQASFDKVSSMLRIVSKDDFITQDYGKQSSWIEVAQGGFERFKSILQGVFTTVPAAA
jgi:hypothetical protein